MSVDLPTLPPPPQAAGLPLLGNLLDIARAPLDFVTQLRREHGDYVLFSLGRGRRVLLVSDPAAIRQVLLETEKRYGKGMSTFAMRSVLGNGLVTSEGELWRRQRKLVAPAFQHHTLGRYVDLMVRLTVEHTAGWRPGAQTDIHEEMMLLTQRIIMMALFDVDVKHNAREAGQAFDAMMRGLAAEMGGLDAFLPDAVPTPSRAQMTKAIAFINERLRVMIEARAGEEYRSDGSDGSAGEGARQDLLAALMASRDDEGKPMPIEQLLDEMRTLYLAGHETTANTLAWTWLLLSRNPEARARAEEEIAGVLAGRLPTHEDVARLPYCNAVIKEALRCYPVAWMHQRMATEDVTIGGHPVARGTFVWMSPWVVHHDARWYPDPEAFRPERWLALKEEQPPADAYIAFGGGPRICLGNGFAMVEGVVLLATILQRCQVAVKPDHRVEVGMKGTIYPKGGLPATVTPRPQPLGAPA